MRRAPGSARMQQWRSHSALTSIRPGEGPDITLSMASPWRAMRPSHPYYTPRRRALSTSACWHTQTAHPSSRVQIYTSRSHNPYLNLSAEHFLLQNSHPDSSILFLYTNDPCIVIGRNQNPWLEVNLSLLKHFSAHIKDGSSSSSSSSSSPVALVRRRSGGGAVFHDRGNVNFSVICPPAVFDRNRHAEMVVRALRTLGEPTARVNTRHDIVVAGNDGAEFKISGSAYKLTRLRSLHHGTCLLASPNLADIGRLLRSPAEPYIKARGVESVRSRIRNVGVGSGAFEEAVRREFGVMYGPPDLEVEMGEEEGAVDFAHAQIQKGVAELMSPEWIYNQTPQFTFSTYPTDDDPRARPVCPQDLPDDFRATLTARHGEIQQAELYGFDGSSLHGQHIHSITDWKKALKPANGKVTDPVGRWFNHLLGNRDEGQP